MSRITRIALVAVAVTLVGCSTAVTPGPSSSPTATVPPTPSPSPTPAAASGSLGEALAYAGPVPQTISFTDWSAIRAAVGAENLNGASPFEDKARAIRNEATLGGFGLRDLRTHAADWGFDVFDLAWETQVSAPGSGFFWVLRVRAGFELSHLTSKLDEYGFATEQLPHGVLRKGSPASLQQGDLLLNNIAFLNTGILDDGRTLVLSGLGDSTRGDPVRTILTLGPQPVADLSAQSVARLLGEPVAAAIRVGDTCHDLGTSGYRPAVRAAVDQQLADVRPLGVYNALAFGYTRHGGPATGRIVMGYPEEGTASADLAGRRRLAEHGISNLSSDPSALLRYPDRLFVVTDGRVEERAIVLEVGPVPLPTRTPSASGALVPTESFPRFLLQSFAQRDMLYAAC